MKDMKSLSPVMRKIQGSHRCLILLLRALFSEETVLNSSEPESDEDGKEPSMKQDGLIGSIF